jgi:general secretion pathway protein N
VTLFEVRPRSALFDTSAGRTELKLPAGAPFDGQKTDAAATAPADQSAPAGAMIIIGPGNAGKPETRSGNGHDPHARNPQEDQSKQPFLDQLRQNIQKRRAAAAAAANEGVR